MTFHELGLSDPLLRAIAAEDHVLPAPAERTADRVVRELPKRHCMGSAGTTTEGDSPSERP